MSVEIPSTKNNGEKTRSLIETSPVPLVILNAENLITDVNDAFTGIIGFSADALIGTDFFEYFTLPLVAHKAYANLSAKESVAGSTLGMRRKDGVITTILFNGVVYNTNRWSILAITLATDTNKIENKYRELLQVVYQKYGYDFRQYSEAHVKRRISNRMSLAGLTDIAQMQYKVLNDPKFASAFLLDLSITVTEMFRDPGFYISLRENVIPILKTYPFIKIWHAGCSSGEEAFSMAILLQEEGLYDRTTIYATDFNQKILNRAKEGIFSNTMMKEYTTNYQLSGGKESLSNYYTSDLNNVIMNQSLKKNIVWANHNLVTDSVFSEVHLILCRNVLIYFDKNLQNKVHTLFYNSLIKGGVLCLGSKENLQFTDLYPKYVGLDSKQRIYKKKY